MDCITIKELKIYANHGVFDFEKENGQNFYITARLFLNLQKPAITDNLCNTVSYADVCDSIVKYTKDNTFDLIETLAEGLAIYILNEYVQVNKVEVLVEKPEAPIELDFKTVSVCITRERHTAYIAYGSNMGDSERIIADAKSRIDESKYCHIVSESSIYKTTPYGKEDQPDFYNGVIKVETYLEPDSLLDFLHKVEAEGGRERKEHWGPRTIDLDIILYDEIVLDTEYLTIPHKDMANRDFVLEPLAEIAGYVRHPLTKKTIAEMATVVSEKHIL